MNFPGVSEDGPYVAPVGDEGEEGGFSTNPEVNQAQAVVKAFVRSLVRGRVVNVLAVNGGFAECTAFLDRKLTTLSLQRGNKGDGKKRPVALEDVSEIIVGEAGGAEFNLATDELCVTLVLESGQAIGFTFAGDEERDTFALCLTMFVDGRRDEVQRQKVQAV